MAKGNGNGSGNGNGHRNGNGKRRRTAGQPVEEPGKRISTSSRAGGRTRKGHGTLIIIGGHEDKEGDKLILRELVRRAGSGKLVVATVASSQPDEMWEAYEPLFRRLGAPHVYHLNIDARAQALDERNIRILDDATAVFFTGGDQLKITSQVGDTPIYQRIGEIFEGGGTIAGTSAGASVMSETMLVSGSGSDSNRIGGNLKMAPGLGLIDDVIIDQHFAERGRIGRLIGAVAQNPRILGLGIDEDTAVIVENRRSFRVLGRGAVYVVDARRMSFSNLAEEESDRATSVFDLRIHVLSQGDTFDLTSREPKGHPAAAIERELVAADN